MSSNPGPPSGSIPGLTQLASPPYHSDGTTSAVDHQNSSSTPAARGARTTALQTKGPPLSPPTTNPNTSPILPSATAMSSSNNGPTQNSSPATSIAMTSNPSSTSWGASGSVAFSTPATHYSDTHQTIPDTHPSTIPAGHLKTETNEDTQMTDITAETQESSSSSQQQDHRRSDHERDAVVKEKEEEGEAADVVEESLRPLFKLCEYDHPVSRPHPSDDLFQLYSLRPLAATVARRDPITGEKINKLRKSYEGKLKAYSLLGKNKATSKSGELSSLLDWPEDEWWNQRVHGKAEKLNQMSTAASSSLGQMDGAAAGKTASDIFSRFEKAINCSTAGKLPDPDSKWKNFFAIDASGGGGGAVASGKDRDRDLSRRERMRQGGSGASPPLSGGGSGAGLGDEPLSAGGSLNRPQRTGKRRRYDDQSFEGYADGDGGEMSSDGEAMATVKKRRKKEFSGSVTSPRSYSMGMVGVGSSH